nr:MAG TPA: hypothetical protein [Caudoviricetes sp.]
MSICYKFCISIKKSSYSCVLFYIIRELFKSTHSVKLIHNLSIIKSIETNT